MKAEKKILIAFILNLSFAVFEVLGGFLTNSVAILSDAIHDFGDALSIGVSYFLERKSKKAPDDSFTYGYLRYSVLGAVFTAIVLLFGSGFVIINAIKRMLNPEPVNYEGMIIFAVIGIVVNFIAAYFTNRGNSLNQKSVNLHMLEDMLSWIIVLIGSILMQITNFVYLDSVLSCGVAVFILINSVKILKISIDIFSEKTPTGISIEKVKTALLELDNVLSVQELHIWSLDGANHCATVHITVDKNFTEVKENIRKTLREFGVEQITVEIKSENEEPAKQKTLKKINYCACGHHTVK